MKKFYIELRTYEDWSGVIEAENEKEARDKAYEEVDGDLAFSNSGGDIEICREEK